MLNKASYPALYPVNDDDDQVRIKESEFLTLRASFIVVPMDGVGAFRVMLRCRPRDESARIKAPRRRVRVLPAGGLGKG